MYHHDKTLPSSIKTFEIVLCRKRFRYRENAVRISRAYNDRPLSPLDTAIFWTEYVIRHRGAAHLRSAALDLTWYQYLLLDVLAVLLCVVVFVFTVTFYVTKITIGFVLRHRSTQKKKRR